MKTYSSKGIPILTIRQKLDALNYCFSQGAWEDVAGHLCDLLDYTRQRIEPSIREPFQDLREMVEHYGANPTPVVDDAVGQPSPEPHRYRSIDEPWQLP